MRTPTPRQRAWIDNPRIQSGTTETGADMAVDPSPATRDANELRRMQRAPGATVEGFAKGGKVKATGAAKVHQGEHVIRKSSAKKYGQTKMQAVNNGTARIDVKKTKNPVKRK